MKWSFSSDTPIYTQLIDQIKACIVTGEFKPGERLPSVRDLATEAGVNPNTMQRALAQLESEGLVFSQRTAGRFVTQENERVDALRCDLAKRHIGVFLSAMHALAVSQEETLALIEAEFRKENKVDECPEL